MGKAVNVVANIASAGTVGYDPSKGGITGGVVSKAVDNATGGKVSGALNDVKGTVLGKDIAATPNEIIDMASPEGRKYQEQLIAQYGKGVGTDVNGIAQQQIAAQENQIIQNAADQKMRAEQLAAQRGLGRSASGIGAILNQQKGINDQISAVRSQLPGLQEQMRQQNLNYATGGINQILGEQGQSKVLKMGQAATKSGGLAPLIGAGVGGYLGGAPGAQVGMASGQYLQKCEVLMVQIIQSGPSQETLRQQAMNDALQGIIQGYAGYEQKQKSDLLTQRQQALADNQTKLKLMEMGIANPDQALAQLKGEYKQTEIAPAQPAQYGQELAAPVMPGQSPLKELLSAAVPAQMSPVNPLGTYTEDKSAKIAADLALQQQNEALKKAQVDMIPLDRQKKEVDIQKIQDDIKLRPLERQTKLADIEFKHSQVAQRTDEKTDKRFGEFAKTVVNPTTRNALGNFGKNLAAADRIKVLTDSYAGGLKHGSPEEIAALDQLTSTQSEEVTKSLDSLLSGGASTISGAEALRFKTLASEWSDLKAKYLNDPKGANLGAFLSRALDTVDREREYNAKQVDRVISGLGEGFSDLKKKDPARFQNIIGSAYSKNESAPSATSTNSTGGSPWLKYGAKK